MKDILRISLLTLAVFGAGLLTGIWTQRVRPLPAPPFGPLDEFSPRDGNGHGGGGKEFGRFPRLSEEKLAELRAEMEKLRPEIEQFQQKLQAIDTDFRTKLDALLTPEQRKLLPNDPMGRKHNFGPRWEEHGPGRFQGPLEGLAFFTIIRPALDNLSRDLKLTAPQQVKLKELLLERRQRFLDLVDTTPPPSLKVGRMIIPPPDGGPHPDQPQHP